MWNGTAETLKARPAATNTRPIRAPVAIASWPSGAGCSSVGQAVERERAGEAVDQRAAVEQHARGERAEHEILEPGLGRARLVAVERGDHVERQALQLEAEIERDQVLAEIIISMPTVANSTSTGNSKRSMPSCSM